MPRSTLFYSDDVKSMMKDILLIWTAVKHLDAGKADRKELENLGVEMNSRNEVLQYKGSIIFLKCHSNTTKPFYRAATY